MKPYRRSAIVAIATGLFVVALVASGCGRRGLQAGAADAMGASPTPAEATGLVVAATPSLPAEPSAAPTPDPTADPTPASTPVPSPNLSAIDALIKDISNDLDADASAGADEGSTP